MKMGSREICDVVLKAKSATKIGSHTFAAGEPVIYFDTAKTSSLEGAATTVYAQGGQGNSRLIAWEGEKTVTFTLEDALISPKGLAILSGADLLQASSTHKVIAHTTETVEVTEKHKISVSRNISKHANAAVHVMLLDSNGEMSGIPMKILDSQISGKDITDAQLFDVGDIVMVDYYVEYTSDAQEIIITPDKFAGYYYLEASTLFRRQVDGVDLPAEFVIPKVKIQSNFTFTMASSGDPSSFTFTMDAFPDYSKFDKTKKILGAIQVLDADDNFDLSGKDEMGEVTYERYKYNKDNGDYLTTKTEGKKTEDDTSVTFP